MKKTLKSQSKDENLKDEKTKTIAAEKSIKKKTEKNQKVKEEKILVKSSSKSEKTFSKSTKEPETMEELLAQVGGIDLGIKRGTTVEGVVISVSPNEVFVDIGKKSYGIVAEWELDQVRGYALALKPGEKVIAQVMNPENDTGYIALSLRKANFERRWIELEKSKIDGIDLDVSGLEVAKGGLLVDWQGLRGFIPFTQLEGNLAVNPMNLIGRNIKVKVLEVDKTINRLVVSQKASALGVTPVIQKEKLDKIKQNDVLKGTVSGIAAFGVFIDVEGLEGLVHISEIAWEKVETPSNLFKVGDKVEIMVLDVNKDEGKLNLSIKRLTPDPWKNILDRYPPEAAIKGTVVRNAPYGVFVRLEPGIEGLLHISKITAGEEPKVGETLECLIEKIDPMKRKISLTLVPKAKPVGYR
jgi:small subunit ribosomal protein S1